MQMKMWEKQQVLIVSILIANEAIELETDSEYFIDGSGELESRIRDWEVDYQLRIETIDSIH